jgi:hypothetical protein
MGIIHRAISTHIVNRAGFSNKQAKTGAVTLIQRSGSALNLNIHFHMLFLEGAINENAWGGITFTRIKAPSNSDIVELVHAISHRIARYLEKVGLVQRDMENSYLSLPVDDEDSHVIQKILAHLDKKYPTSKQTTLLPPLRAPPDVDYDFNIQRDFNFGA